MEMSEKEFDGDGLVRELRDANAQLRAENLRLKDRIAELEKKNPTKRLDVPYSVRSEEQRQAKAKKVRKPKQAKKPKRRGRRTHCEKVDLAQRGELVLPARYAIEECHQVGERVVWRIENGRAVRVVYHIYRSPNGERGAIDSVVPTDELTKEFYLLVHEPGRLMAEEELFTFVLHPEADGTNNEAERSLRGAALDHRTGRTSKTAKGARRKTILTSVFESFKLHLPRFDLASVLQEVVTWQLGESLFTQLMQSSGLSPPNQPTLEKRSCPF